MNTAYPPLRPVEPRPPILPSQSLHQDDQRSPTSYRLPSAIPVSSQNGISAHLPISSSNANNAEAGPSNSSVSVNTLSSTTTNTKKRVGVANARKRQRAAAFEDVIGSGTGPVGTGGLGAGNGGGPAGVGIEDAGRPPAKQRESPKKKKAQRACAHCQKAHLTCDDSTFYQSLSLSHLARTLFSLLPSMGFAYISSEHHEWYMCSNELRVVVFVCCYAWLCSRNLFLFSVFF